MSKLCVHQSSACDGCISGSEQRRRGTFSLSHEQFSNLLAENSASVFEIKKLVEKVLCNLEANVFFRKNSTLIVVCSGKLVICMIGFQPLCFTSRCNRRVGGECLLNEVI